MQRILACGWGSSMLLDLQLLFAEICCLCLAQFLLSLSVLVLNLCLLRTSLFHFPISSYKSFVMKPELNFSKLLLQHNPAHYEFLSLKKLLRNLLPLILCFSIFRFVPAYNTYTCKNTLFTPAHACMLIPLGTLKQRKGKLSRTMKSSFIFSHLSSLLSKSIANYLSYDRESVI